MRRHVPFVCIPVVLNYRERKALKGCDEIDGSSIILDSEVLP